MIIRRAGAYAPVLAMTMSLGACATIIEGTDQPVGIITTPPGAECTLTRDSKVIAQVSPTPGQVVVEKSKNDILIDCKKEGYQPVRIVAKSSFNGTTFGNLLLGGVVGVVVDASSGANQEYPESITIPLTPLGQPAPAAPVPDPKADDKKAAPPTS